MAYFCSIFAQIFRKKNTSITIRTMINTEIRMPSDDDELDDDNATIVMRKEVSFSATSPLLYDALLKMLGILVKTSSASLSYGVSTSVDVKLCRASLRNY